MNNPRGSDIFDGMFQDTSCDQRDVSQMLGQMSINYPDSGPDTIEL